MPPVKTKCRVLTGEELQMMYFSDFNKSTALSPSKNENCRFLRRYIKRIMGKSDVLEKQIKGDYLSLGCSRGSLNTYLKKSKIKSNKNVHVLAVLGIIIVTTIAYFSFRSIGKRIYGADQ